MTHSDISLAEKRAVLERLYDSGCRKIVIGFESIVPESLYSLERWKYRKLKNYAESIRIIQSYGIGVWGDFYRRTGQRRSFGFSKGGGFYSGKPPVRRDDFCSHAFSGIGSFERLNREKRILTEHWGRLHALERRGPAQKYECEGTGGGGFAYTLRQIYSPEASRERMQYFKKFITPVEGWNENGIAAGPWWTALRDILQRLVAR